MGRNDTAKYVTLRFEFRDKRRLYTNDPSKDDKSDNPVITISASPGLGKSSFLVNFPESWAYKNYCNVLPAIVSTLTFNKGMAFNKDVLGLRIIYGALRSMRVISETLPFKEFLKEVDSTSASEKSKYKSLTAKDAVNILRKVFDPASSTSETSRRPMLILVDEISKAKDDKKVASQLGAVLDAFGDVNVVVSSLSPGYVADVVGNRPVDFVILNPMLDANLGSEECLEWANTLITSVQQSDPTIKIDSFKENVLKNAYLLFSGHPRLLERMVDIIKSGDIDSVMIDNLSQTQETATSLLHLLVDNMYEAVQRSIVTLDEFEEYVLKTPPLFQKEDSGFRKNLEKGSILIYEKIKTEYVTCIPAISFLNKLQSKSFWRKARDYEHCDAANKLIVDLMNIAKPLKPGTWWEKIVCFTIASRYFSKFNTDTLLGINLSGVVIRDKKRTLSITKSDNLSNIIENTNNDQLFIPFMNTAGFDALLLLHAMGKKEFFYLQTKVALPKAPLTDVVSNMIKYNLDHYLGDNNKVLSVDDRKRDDDVLDDLHMVLYVWGINDSVIRSQVSQDMVLETLQNSTARKYVKDHWKQIHLVGTDTLKSWINPTMVPLAKLFNNIQDNLNV